jgi:hypothetical protein
MWHQEVITEAVGTHPRDLKRISALAGFILPGELALLSTSATGLLQP